MKNRNKRVALMLLMVITFNAIVGNVNSKAASTDIYTAYYNLLKTKNSDHYFTIVDLNNDKIPELILVEGFGNNKNSKMTYFDDIGNISIYTYKNNKVTEIKTSYNGIYKEYFYFGGEFALIKIDGKFLMTHYFGHIPLTVCLSYLNIKDQICKLDTYSEVIFHYDEENPLYYHNNSKSSNSDKYTKLKNKFNNSEKVVFYKNNTTNRDNYVKRNASIYSVVGYNKKLEIQSQYAKKVTWTSSDEKIVKVDKDGNIEPKKSGTAKVTAKIQYSNYTDKYTYNVTVYNKKYVLDQMYGTWRNHGFPENQGKEEWIINSKYIDIIKERKFKYKITKINIDKNKDIIIYYTEDIEDGTKYRMQIKYNSKTTTGQKGKSYTNFYLEYYDSYEGGYTGLDMGWISPMYKK